MPLPYEEEAKEFTLTDGTNGFIRELNGLEEAQIIALVPHTMLMASPRFILAAQVVSIKGERLIPERPRKLVDLESRLQKLRAKQWDEISTFESAAFVLLGADEEKNSSGGTENDTN